MNDFVIFDIEETLQMRLARGILPAGSTPVAMCDGWALMVLGSCDFDNREIVEFAQGIGFPCEMGDDPERQSLWMRKVAPRA